MNNREGIAAKKERIVIVHKYPAIDAGALRVVSFDARTGDLDVYIRGIGISVRMSAICSPSGWRFKYPTTTVTKSGIRNGSPANYDAYVDVIRFRPDAKLKFEDELRRQLDRHQEDHV